MEYTQLLAAGAVGLIVGFFAMLAFWYSEQQKGQQPPPTPDVLEDGVIRVLAVLRSAAVVIKEDDTVVRASAPAYALGVVRGERIVHPAIQDMIDSVRRSGLIADEELELPRGPVGRGRVMLQVRVAQLDSKHIVVLAEDKTEAKRVETIRRDFTVNVSHELKTPVGAIGLLAETLQDAADDPEAVRHFAGRMSQESKRLAQLVQEIIELSRLQLQGSSHPVSIVEVAGVIEEATDRARVVAQGKDISITVGGDSEVYVYGDHNLLVTAVRNLVDNAVAYSPEHTSVGVGVHRRGELIEISVVDQGFGIPVEQQARVFERFYRVDPARSRATGGTGLGLSIVKHVAADHGGDVTVWSQEGKGSTFTLRIPAVADADPGDATTLPPFEAASAQSPEESESDANTRLHRPNRVLLPTDVLEVRSAPRPQAAPKREDGA
ncbi:sensor histidine kinase [Timonella senegalensis]|uniref:sensor histidine kinase n=1 Tax=Timonella senegalensis TaxID=1465825 RepID=UPI0028AD51E6|nr:ATP-binding protein [Timonella senegalensis]